MDMETGILKGSATDIIRDFAPVPVGLVLGSTLGVAGSVITIIASPYIAKSQEGARMGQFTGVLLLSDQIVSYLFGSPVVM